MRDGTLEAESKSVVSQQEANNIESQHSIPMPIQLRDSQADGHPGTRVAQAWPLNLGPNVVMAESEAIMRHPSQTSTSQWADPSASNEPSIQQQINRNTPSIINNNSNNLSNNRMVPASQGDMHHAAQATATQHNMSEQFVVPISTATAPIIIGSIRNHSIQDSNKSISMPMPILNMVSMPLLNTVPNTIPNMMLTTTNMMQNKYPSPSKVVILEQIEKGMQARQPGEYINIMQHQTNRSIESHQAISNINSSVNINNNSMQALSHNTNTNTNTNINNNTNTSTNIVSHANALSNTNTISHTNPSVSIGVSVRQMSPPTRTISTSPNIANNRPVPVTRNSTANIVDARETRINVSPPHFKQVPAIINSIPDISSGSSKQMFETFNPNSNKRISIYTNRQPIAGAGIGMNRSESPISNSASNRSASPPTSQQIITPIHNIEASRTGIDSGKSSRIVMNQGSQHRNEYDLEQTVDKRMSFAPSAYQASNSNTANIKASFIHKITNTNANTAGESIVNPNANYPNTNTINDNMGTIQNSNTNYNPTNYNPTNISNASMRMAETKTHKRTHSL